MREGVRSPLKTPHKRVSPGLFRIIKIRLIDFGKSYEGLHSHIGVKKAPLANLRIHFMKVMTFASSRHGARIFFSKGGAQVGKIDFFNMLLMLLPLGRATRERGANAEEEN